MTKRPKKKSTLLATCTICGDLCGDPPKHSAFTGELMCADCLAEDNAAVAQEVRTQEEEAIAEDAEDEAP